jgi:hypothetical protein
MGVRTWKDLLREDLERRLDVCLEHYALHRPHQSLSEPAERQPCPSSRA